MVRILKYKKLTRRVASGRGGVPVGTRVYKTRARNPIHFADGKPANAWLQSP
jgi:hypothetical protein